MRLLIEVLIPLIIFMYIFAIRTLRHSEEMHECYFPIRSLPTAGEFPFFRNVICHRDDICFETKDTSEAFNPQIFVDQMKKMSTKKSRRKRDRGVDMDNFGIKAVENEIQKIRKLSQVISKVTDYQHLQHESNGGFYLENIIKNSARLRKKFKRRMNETLSAEFVNNILKSEITVDRLSMEQLNSIMEDPSSILCNWTTVNQLFNNKPFKESFYLELCSFSKKQFKLVLDIIESEIDTDIMNQIHSYFSNNFFEIISWEDWHELVTALTEVVTDINKYLLITSSLSETPIDFLLSQNKIVTKDFFLSIRAVICQEKGMHLVGNKLRLPESNDLDYLKGPKMKLQLNNSDDESDDSSDDDDKDAETDPPDRNVESNAFAENDDFFVNFFNMRFKRDDSLSEDDSDLFDKTEENESMKKQNETDTIPSIFRKILDELSFFKKSNNLNSTEKTERVFTSTDNVINTLDDDKVNSVRQFEQGDVPEEHSTTSSVVTVNESPVPYVSTLDPLSKSSSPYSSISFNMVSSNFHNSFRTSNSSNGSKMTSVSSPDYMEPDSYPDNDLEPRSYGSNITNISSDSTLSNTSPGSTITSSHSPQSKLTSTSPDSTVTSSQSPQSKLTSTSPGSTVTSSQSPQSKLTSTSPGSTITSSQSPQSKLTSTSPGSIATSSHSPQSKLTSTSPDFKTTLRSSISKRSDDTTVIPTNRPDDKKPEDYEALLMSNYKNSQIFISLWKQLKQFVRGQIVYGPKTKLTEKIMKRFDTQFLWLKDITLLFEKLNEKQRKKKRDLISDLDTGSTKDFLQTRLGQEALKSSLSKVMDNNVSEDNITIFKKSFDWFIAARAQANDEILQHTELIVTFLKAFVYEKTSGFDTLTQATEEAENLVEKDNLFALILFENIDPEFPEKMPPLVQYKIRMNSQYVLDTYTILPYSIKPGRPPTRPKRLSYFIGGFIYIQDLLERFIILEKANLEKADLPGYDAQVLPYPCFIKDDFLLLMGFNFPLFMVHFWMCESAFIVYCIVWEKENHMKKTMRVIGVCNDLYWVAWFIENMVVMFIICCLVTTLVLIGNVLVYSNWLVIFIHFITYAFALVMFSFLISTFFDKANIAAACAGMISFLMYLPFLFSSLDSHGFDSTNIEKIFLFLNPSLAFKASIEYITSFEQFEKGATFNTILSHDNYHDAWCLLYIYLFFLFDGMIYLILALYIEQVFPGSTAGYAPKPWFYPCGYIRRKERRHKLPHVFEVIEQELKGKRKASLCFETEPPGAVTRISIENLSKSFKNNYVLKDISVNFYEDQITALVGQPGAGKTVLLYVLVGIYQPTAGTVLVNGVNTRSKFKTVRKTVGVCFQCNMLYPLLTFEEHALMYGQLRTGSYDIISEETEQFFTDLELTTEKQNLVRDSTLTCQRKLCVALAFVGGTRVVMLDAPTQGVDVVTRKLIWDFIEKYKRGRTVVIATQNMFEADLADRIAVLINGNLEYCGTSTFLRGLFDHGYRLTILMDITAVTNDGKVMLKCLTDIIDAVNSVVPNALFVEKAGREVTFELPDKNDTSNIIKLIQLLDTQSKTLYIMKYAVTTSTLEDIFSKIDLDSRKRSVSYHEEQFKNMQEKLQNSKSSGKSVSLLGFEPMDQTPFKIRRSKTMNQIAALSKKILKRARRTPSIFILPIIVGPLLLLSVYLLFLLFNGKQTENPLTTQMYPKPLYVFHDLLDPLYQQFVDQINKNGQGIGPICLPDYPDKNYRETVCTAKNTPTPGATGVASFGRKCNCTKGFPRCDKISKANMPPFVTVASGETFYDLTQSNVGDWVIKTWEEYELSRLGGYILGFQTKIPNLDIKTFVNSLINGEEINPGEFTYLKSIKILFHNRALDSPLVLLNAFNNVLLKTVLLGQNVENAEKHGIMGVSQPMDKNNYQQYGSVSQFRMPWTLFRTICLLLCLCVVISSSAPYVIECMGTELRHLEIVSGLNVIIFWIYIFVWDYIRYTICAILCTVILLVFKINGLVGEIRIYYFILFLIFFGWASIPFVYCLCLMFQESKGTFLEVLTINLFLGTFTNLIPYILATSEDEYLVPIGVFLKGLMIMLPHSCFGAGIIEMEISYFYDTVYSQYDVTSGTMTSFSLLGSHITSRIVLIVLLFINGLIWFGILIYSDKTRFGNFKCGKKEKEVVQQQEGFKGKDLKAEYVNALSKEVLADKDNVIAVHLTRTRQAKFKREKLVPVHNITFVVSKGECFGILGVRGSGRSSLSKILAGLVKPDSGDIRVMGVNIKNNVSKVRSFIGYCPRTCQLDPHLTPKEHLYYFGKLKNIPNDEMKQNVQYCLINAGLQSQANIKLSKSESGTQKKLLLAIAVLGNPPVLILDEPTLGLETLSKNCHWNFIQKLLSEGHIILLTSRSSEECEAICTRFAIIVHGSFHCIGTTRYIKDKYCSGYRLTIKCLPLNEERANKFKRYIKKRLTNGILIEETHNRVLYYFPLSSLCEAFEIMDLLLQKKMVSDYIITTTTVHDTFTKLTTPSRPGEAEEETEPPSFIWRLLVPTLISGLTFCLCFELFSSADVINDANDIDERQPGDDSSEQSSSDESRAAGRNRSCTIL